MFQASMYGNFFKTLLFFERIKKKLTTAGSTKEIKKMHRLPHSETYKILWKNNEFEDVYLNLLVSYKSRQ